MVGLLYNPQKAMEYPIFIICHAFNSMAHGTAPFTFDGAFILAQMMTCNTKFNNNAQTK